VTAREEALIPAMQMAWQHMQPEIEAGIQLQPEAAREALRASRDAMSDALESGDRFQVGAQDWAQLSTLAIAGVNAQMTAGEIGPGVAASLLERIANFNEAYLLLVTR
jgi:L-serine deaminase